MEIVRQLNAQLPQRYLAEPTVHLGGAVEVDIGAHEMDPYLPEPGTTAGGIATVPALEPTLVVEADLSTFPEVDVRIYDVHDELERVLVAAIEIVSPANKDRPGSREAFATKVLSLLQQGVSVSIVDLVTTRTANLYGEVLELLGLSDPKVGSNAPPLYATTLRGRARRNQPTLLEGWYFPMTIGEALPTLPIWLSPDRHILLPLETSYEEVCRVLRIS